VQPLTTDGSIRGTIPEGFGPFRVLHQVGAGTLGPVFRAYDAVEGRLVAIKAFHLDLTPEQAAALSDALDDLRTRALDHPSIAAPIAAGIEGATPWFAQAYIPAETLDTALRQYGPAPIADALTMITHLAGALDFAAAAGVFHGALHLRDVLVAPDETHVIDLGVAPALEAVGLRVPIRRPYAAPELVDGAPITRAVDIFALGALAYEMITGKRVSGDGDDAVAGMPEIPGADRDALLETFGFALAVAPDERFASALAFVASLKRALGPAATSRTVLAPRPAANVATPSADEALQTGARLSEPTIDAGETVPAGTLLASSSSGELPLQSGDHEHAPSELASDPHRAPATASRHPRTAAPRTPRAADTPHPPDRTDQEHPADVVPPAPTGPPPTSRRAATDPASAASASAAERHDGARRATPLGWDAPAAPLTVVGSSDPADELAYRESGHPLPAPVAPASRSWALFAGILIAGIVLGFAGGYAWMSRSSPSAPAPAVVSDAGDAPGGAPAARPGSEAPAPQEYSERSVAPPRASAPASSGPLTDSRRGEAAARPAPPVASPPPSATPLQRREASVVRGRLMVRSTPTGARVEVNGRYRGTTPVTLRDLPLKSMAVRVSRTGYEPREQRVSLSRARSSDTVAFSLKPVATTARTQTSAPASARDTGRDTSESFLGSVLFDSRPVGARVYLDGNFLGVTPLQVPEVRAGSHAVRFEKDGFRRWTASVPVVAGERNRVAASLEESVR
jgi:eukaryotic-like serine/threonine-protein kinase